MINVHRFMGSARVKAICGALLLAVAGLAHAGTLVGGGSTLVAIGYVGSNAASHLQVWGIPADNNYDPIASTSLFGVYSAETGNPQVSYCEAGDGAGKDILAGGVIATVTFNVQNPCNAVIGNPTGFGADLSGVNRYDLTQPNFVASDLPLNASDYSNYVSNHSSGAYPTQFPAVASAIAIAFHLTDALGNQVTSSQVNFSDAQLCAIFSGEVTNWADPSLVSAYSLPAGDVIPPGPINVQYHSEGSGITFGLSNHLANVCGAVQGAYFETNAAFVNMVGNFFGGSASALPSNWTGSNGDWTVASAIMNTANSIGYVETIDALAVGAPLQVAYVNGRSPITNFGVTLNIAANDVVYNEAIAGANNANGTATLQVLSGAPATQCIALVPPADYATSSSAKGSLLPPTSYPIVSVSYLLANAAGNGPDLVATQGLLTAPYNATVRSAVTTIGPGTGLAFLNLGKGAFTSLQVAGCLVN